MSSREADLRDEVRSLLTRSLDNPASIAEMSSAEVDLLIRLARTVRLHGRLGSDIRQAGVEAALPDTATDQLTSALRMAEARARLAAWELNRIEWALSDLPDISVCCLKGCAYMALSLPNHAGRIFADVDLLVAEQDLEKVEKALNDRGWHTRDLNPYDDNYYRRWTHELPPLVHPDREVEIDLHHNILPRTARLKPPAAALLRGSQPSGFGRYRVLSDTDIVLHAVVHLIADSDMADKLRDLVDIADLARYFAAERESFWERICERADELGLARPAFYAFRYLDLCLQQELPGYVTEWSASRAPSRFWVWLMDKLVPAALFPVHPESKGRSANFCRLLLYVRSHWTRMPPWLLCYHLAYKFFVVRLLRRRVA